jgi:hypothetical protein
MTLFDLRLLAQCCLRAQRIGRETSAMSSIISSSGPSSKYTSYDSKVESASTETTGRKRQSLATYLLYSLLFILSFAYSLSIFRSTSIKYSTSHQSTTTNVNFDWDKVRTANASCIQAGPIHTIQGESYSGTSLAQLLPKQTMCQT